MKTNATSKDSGKKNALFIGAKIIQMTGFQIRNHRGHEKMAQHFSRKKLSTSNPIFNELSQDSLI